MTVRSGELTDLIVFEKKVRTYDGEIEYTSWVRDFQEWADAARLAEQITSFRIHYRRGITPDTHRILAFDSVWTITNVLPDARYAELKIECDWSAQIEVTHMKSPTREWITGLPAVAMPIPEDEDEEFMKPIITDITHLIEYPQPGAGFGSGGLIAVIQTGKLNTVVIDANFVVPPGVDDDVVGFQLRLPPQYNARSYMYGPTASIIGLDYPSSMTYLGEEETPPIPVSAGAMYFLALTDPGLLSLFFYSPQIKAQGAVQIYVTGQLTYIAQ